MPVSWTTPRTWVAGELVTSSMLNVHVRDNTQYLKDNMPSMSGYLPLTGGTMSGAITWGTNNPNPAIRARHIDGKATGTDTGDTLYLNYSVAGKGIQIGDSGTDHPLVVYGTITSYATEMILESSGSYQPQLRIKNTNADATGPYLIFEKDSASPAQYDKMGTILFRMRDSGGNLDDVAEYSITVDDKTAGSEDTYGNEYIRAAGVSTMVRQWGPTYNFLCGSTFFGSDWNFYANKPNSDTCQFYFDAGAESSTAAITYTRTLNRLMLTNKIFGDLYCQPGGAPYYTSWTLSGGLEIASGNLILGSGYIWIVGSADAAGNIRFSAANPYISASSYIVMPGGLYVSGGTLYVQNVAQMRGGIQSDTTNPLLIYGGLTNGDVAIQSGGALYFSRSWDSNFYVQHPGNNQYPFMAWDVNDLITYQRAGNAWYFVQGAGGGPYGLDFSGYHILYNQSYTAFQDHDMNAHSIWRPIAISWGQTSSRAGAGNFYWDVQRWRSDNSIYYLGGPGGVDYFYTRVRGWYLICGNVLLYGGTPGARYDVQLYLNQALYHNYMVHAAGDGYVQLRFASIGYINANQWNSLYSATAGIGRYGDVNANWTTLAVYKLN